MYRSPETGLTPPTTTFAVSFTGSAPSLVHTSFQKYSPFQVAVWLFTVTVLVAVATPRTSNVAGTFRCVCCIAQRTVEGVCGV